MTTIAYRDGVLAADGLATCNGYVESTTEQKIWRRGAMLFGASGSCTAAEAFKSWTLSGMPGEHRFGADENESGNGLAVMPDGLVLTWSHKGMWKTRCPFYAIGSGQELASGAMAHGATAEEAVRAAALIDTRTGGRTMVLRH